VSITKIKHVIGGIGSILLDYINQ